MADPWDFSTPVWYERTACQDYPTFEQCGSGGSQIDIDCGQVGQLASLNTGTSYILNVPNVVRYVLNEDGEYALNEDGNRILAEDSPDDIIYPEFDCATLTKVYSGGGGTLIPV